MKRLLVGGATVSLLLISGCDLNVPFEENFFSFVNVQNFQENGDLLVEPTAIFFRGPRAELPDSRNVQEGCVVGPFIPDQPPPSLDEINGGDQVFVESGLAQIVLEPEFGVVRTTYRRTSETPLVLAPTASVTIRTVGVDGGFPAMSHTIGLATPPSMNTAVVPGAEDANQNMQVTWTDPTNDAAIKIEMIIEYVDAQDAFIRLLCLFHDDGSAEVDAGFIPDLRSANTITLSKATRFRGNFTQTGSSAIAAVSFAESPLIVERP